LTITASLGTVQYADGAWTWSYAAADGPAGPQTVTITANDGDGGVTVATFDVTVTNVAPTLTISGADSGVEGASYTLNLAASDPGADTIAQWVVNWGDGIVETVAGNPSSVAHAYADGSDSYTISASAADEDGAYDANTLVVAIANVAPTVAVSGNAAVNEGAAYTLNLSATDPGADTVFEWLINWGDGTVETIAGNPASTTHAYADGDNVYSISATAQDEDGQYTAAAIGVAVENVAPTLVISGNSTVNEAAAYSLNLAASDPGLDAIIDWVIDWGDGSTPQTITGNPTSTSHTYADGNAAHTIVATATDDDGSYSSNSLAVTVMNVDPTADAGGGYITFDDTAVKLTGTGSDVAGAEDPLSYAWDLDNNGTFETAGETVYFTPEAFGIVGTGVRTVRLQVTDGDGGVAVDEATVQVIGEGTLLLDGVLYVVGDRTAGDLVLLTQIDADIHVLATYDNNVPSVFAAADVAEVVVRTRGGADVFVATSNVVQPMSIDGGDGNDFLKGGGGENVVLGGDGHDTLYGSGGYDRLLGGLGDDDLLGFGGDDVLVGGGGRDIVNGGDGRDLLIGGCNEDLLHGGTAEDILIGGYTSHDEDLAALDSIMAIWGSEASFDSRVATLTGTDGLLVAGSTVFDDDAADHIIGSAGRDLAFADTSKNWDGVKDTVSLSPAQDTLIALN
ncbi:MAG TPA: PKD domain-containing protein, partial [Lacipirellula sp.]